MLALPTEPLLWTPPLPRGWGRRDSGVLVPEALVNWVAPEPPGLQWIRWEASGSLFGALGHWFQPQKKNLVTFA